MTNVLDLAPGPLPGTRRGKRAGLLVLCQCCRERPHVMAVVERGRLIIQPAAHTQHAQRHYVELGADVCERMAENGKIWCACCDPDTDFGRIMAEIRDGLVIIRGWRHGRPHFVALDASRLQVLLASPLGSA